MRLFLILIFTLTSISLGFGQVSGDIMFTGFNADGDDDFSIIILNELPDTTIYFTDKDWVNNNFESGEGTLIWSTDGAINAGTRVIFTDVDSDNNPLFGSSIGTLTDTGSFNISGTGDAIWCFVTNGIDTTFITAITNEDSEFSNIENANLINGTNAIDLSEGSGTPDGGKYIGLSQALTKNDFLILLNDLSNNWNILGSTADAETLLPFETTAFEFTNSKTLNTSVGFRLLSSPVTVSYSSLLNPIWTQGASTGADATNGAPNVFTWSKTSTNGDNTNWNGVTDLTGNITAGEGFLVYVYADDDFDGSDDAFPKTLSVSGTEHAVDVSPTINPNGDGWTLLGNPFASTLDFDLLTINEITGTAYVWDPNAGGFGEWKTWNGSAGDITDGLITPYQGFFVQTQSSPSSPSVVFPSGAKSTGGTFYGKTMESLSFLRMNVENGKVSNSAWIQLSNQGSAVTTRGDAHELQPLTDTYAQLGFIKNDSVFDIVHLNAEKQVMVPIEFNSTEGGTFTLNVTYFHVLDAFELTFHDFEEKISLPMDDSFSYSFETVKLKKQDMPPLSMLSINSMQFESTDANRFGITIRPTSVNNEVIEKPMVFALDQNYPNPFNPSTTISYTLSESGAVNIGVYNLMGQRIATLVDEYKSAGIYNISWNAKGASSGMYYYRLEANGNAITRKMTLIK